MLLPLWNTITPHFLMLSARFFLLHYFNRLSKLLYSASMSFLFLITQYIFVSSVKQSCSDSITSTMSLCQWWSILVPCGSLVWLHAVLSKVLIQYFLFSSAGFLLWRILTNLILYPVLLCLPWQWVIQMDLQCQMPCWNLCWYCVLHTLYSKHPVLCLPRCIN